MKYIEAPNNHTSNEKSLFVAGWISNCPNWQEEFILYFKDKTITIFNPRRKNFDINNKNLELEQITWEHNHLEKADIISFWFPKETLCPIVLYELWKYIKSDKQIFIWVDSEYQRKSDVEIQTKLVNPDIEIVYSIKDLAEQILKTL